MQLNREQERKGEGGRERENENAKRRREKGELKSKKSDKWAILRKWGER